MSSNPPFLGGSSSEDSNNLNLFTPVMTMSLLNEKKTYEK